METAALPTPGCWRLSAATWPLLLQGSMIPTNIDEPSSVMTLWLSVLPFRGESPWKFLEIPLPLPQAWSGWPWWMGLNGLSMEYALLVDLPASCDTVTPLCPIFSASLFFPLLLVTAIQGILLYSAWGITFSRLLRSSLTVSLPYSSTRGSYQSAKSLVMKNVF